MARDEVKPYSPAALQRLDLAGRQLDRVLSFFPRVDSKINALAAVVIGLLGVLVLNFRSGDHSIWYLAIPFAATAILGSIALYQLYHASFPSLDGGTESLIYFREIRRLTENAYISKALNASAEDLATDCHAQIWRNSEILFRKYEHVKKAFLLTAAMLATWLVSIMFSAIVHGNLIVR
jgi:hypothetical protein